MFKHTIAKGECAHNAFPFFLLLPKTTGKKRFQTPEKTLRRLPTSCHLLEFLQTLIEVIDSRPRIVLLAAASNATVGREQRYLRPRIDNPI